MLDAPENIDATVPIPPDVLMLVISDTHPWPDPDSEKRFQQFRDKIQAYCRYVADDRFGKRHPGARRDKIVISFVSTVPASGRMREFRTAHCEIAGCKLPILVSFADESGNSAHSLSAEQQSFEPRISPASLRKSWLFTQGLIVAGIGAIPAYAGFHYATKLASMPEFRNTIADNVMGVCFCAGALIVAVGVGMILWSEQIPADSDSKPANPTDVKRFTARAAAKRRLLIRGWVVAGIGVVPMFLTQMASQPGQSPVTDTLMRVGFWAGTLTLVAGSGMVLWSQQK